MGITLAGSVGFAAAAVNRIGMGSDCGAGGTDALTARLTAASTGSISSAEVTFSAGNFGSADQGIAAGLGCASCRSTNRVSRVDSWDKAAIGERFGSASDWGGGASLGSTGSTPRADSAPSPPLAAGLVASGGASRFGASCIGPSDVGFTGGSGARKRTGDSWRDFSAKGRDSPSSTGGFSTGITGAVSATGEAPSRGRWAVGIDWG